MSRDARRSSLRNLRAHKVRLLLTVISVRARDRVRGRLVRLHRHAQAQLRHDLRDAATRASTPGSSRASDFSRRRPGRARRPDRAPSPASRGAAADRRAGRAGRPERQEGRHRRRAERGRHLARPAETVRTPPDARPRPRADARRPGGRSTTARRASATCTSATTSRSSCRTPPSPPSRIVGIYRVTRDRRLRRRAVQPGPGDLAVHRRHALLGGRRRRDRPVSRETGADRRDREGPAGRPRGPTGDQVRDADTERRAPTRCRSSPTSCSPSAIIALLVGTFIIYNTFSMIVAQRLRELALLRAIGAEPQAGPALGRASRRGHRLHRQRARARRRHRPGLRAARPARRARPRPAGRRLVLSPRTVIISLLLGTRRHVLSASTPGPARGPIAPVAAMREEFAAPAAASLRRRTIIGVVIGAVGGRSHRVRRRRELGRRRPRR